VELVLHPDHERMLCDELHMRHSDVRYNGREFNGIPVLEEPCCRTPWLLNEDGQRWEL